jgi:hypothetical protein
MNDESDEDQGNDFRKSKVLLNAEPMRHQEDYTQLYGYEYEAVLSLEPVQKLSTTMLRYNRCGGGGRELDSFTIVRVFEHLGVGFA